MQTKVIAFLSLFITAFGTLQAHAQNTETRVEIPLAITEVPQDQWAKGRITPLLDDGKLIMRDLNADPFNDASYWEITFNTPLPFGRKELSFDVSIGADHTALWGDALFQPIINGQEAVPTLNKDGAPSTILQISDDDGKGFLTMQPGTVTFQMGKTDERISSFAFMTAGAQSYDLTLSNFKVNAWPEDDTRTYPQRPQASSLGYRAGGPINIFVDWHDDPASSNTAKINLTLTTPNGDQTIPVTLPGRRAAISDSRVSRINLGDLPPGNYALTVPAIGDLTTPTTRNFDVTDLTPLQNARDQAWDVFYWITEGPHGPYPDAHPQDSAAQVFGAPDQTQDVRGGWLDAGDYGKYSVNGAYSVAMMLITGLIAPDALNHDITQIANTPADVPDWLRVADAQLDWLSKMQRADGAVYHKATTRDWAGMNTTPEADSDIKWLMPVTTTATADFAGTMALAAKLYQQQSDPAYQNRAADFQQAAERALAWLDAHPNLIMADPVYDGAQYGGPYDDTDDSDERFFARAAYAALTDGALDADLIRTQSQALKTADFDTSWQSVGMLGMWALASLENAPDGVNDTLRTAAYRWRIAQSRSSWDVAMEDSSQMAWGSNSAFATSAWHWLLWADHSGEDRYIANAERQLHYLFGANPLGKTYISGNYRNALAAPHFRPWSSGRIDLPAGLIAGGPNSINLAGDPLSGSIAGQPPMRMYMDDVESYATNEVAINWQSVWALSASLLHAALHDR